MRCLLILLMHRQTQNIFVTQFLTAKALALQENQNDHLGVMDRLSILLNSECQTYFTNRDKIVAGSDSTLSIGNYGPNDDTSTSDKHATFSTPTHFGGSDSTTNDMAVEDVLFHLANVLFLISYLAPPTRYGQVGLHSGLCIGFLILATWAWNIVCAPDVFVWYFAFTILNAGQLLYILYQVPYEFL